MRAEPSRESLPRPRPAPRLARAAIAVALALPAAGCRLLVDANEDELGPPPVACSPGERLSCPCPNGAIATQVCNDGGGYEPCDCAGAGQGGAPAVR